MSVLWSWWWALDGVEQGGAALCIGSVLLLACGMAIEAHRGEG